MNTLYNTPMFLLSICLFSFLLIFHILAAIYLFGDAKKRGGSGLLWSLLGFIFGLVAFLTWMLIRGDPEYREIPYYYPGYSTPYPFYYPYYGPVQQNYRKPPGNDY